ncbi:hypothetical protein H5410_051669 [Solanum commersonii]|uniref:Uncharacterized protein n=1 Tax=Solanum commersonii TaxID=4109 RepID=A0A9J5WZ48_SOLCO|nr:hypothetical protein H5410_051669 [Solanum commersonii]
MGFVNQNIGVPMKNLKRGVKLGRWLTRSKREALCTIGGAISKLLGRKECTLPLESQDAPFTQEENENLWKQSVGEPIRGSPTLSVKGDRKKKSWYCGSSSSSFDGGDRETISRNGENILPPCPLAKDESDQEGDENDKSDKESEGDEE